MNVSFTKSYAFCPVCKTLVPYDEANRTFKSHGKANEGNDCPNGGQLVPPVEVPEVDWNVHLPRTKKPTRKKGKKSLNVKPVNTNQSNGTHLSNKKLKAFLYNELPDVCRCGKPAQRGRGLCRPCQKEYYPSKRQRKARGITLSKPDPKYPHVKVSEKTSQSKDSEQVKDDERQIG